MRRKVGFCSSLLLSVDPALFRYCVLNLSSDLVQTFCGLDSLSGKKSCVGRRNSFHSGTFYTTAWTVNCFYLIKLNKGNKKMAKISKANFFGVDHFICFLFVFSVDCCRNLQ